MSFKFPAPQFTQIPNIFFDKIAKTLKEGELRILFMIMRQTFGWHKEWDRMSLSQLSEKTGLDRRSVMRSVKSLLDSNLIKKHKEGSKGNEKCWYALVCEEPEKEKEIPGDMYEDVEDLIDDSKTCYQGHKAPPPRDLKPPTKETLTKEKESPIVPKGTPPSSSKKNTTKEEYIEVAPEVFLSPKQRTDVLRRVGNDESKLQRCLDKLSAWKLKKQITGSSDYSALIKWVIEAVETDLKTPKKEDRVDLDAKYAASVERAFPTHPDISYGHDYIEFNFGPMNHPHIKFGENGFREQVENNLRKLGLKLP